MMADIDQRAARRCHRRVQWRARSIRRAERQEEDKDGEEYAAHW
jgi:hypothetical protein